MTDIIACDYAIVGAGSAGCVLADRLSADGSNVVLLEAGPSDWHPMIHIPAGVLHLLHNKSINWMYASEPGEGVNDRAIHWPRGKVLGGSSSINGMLFIRGNAADYDGWAQAGCTGWSFTDCLPHFMSMEAYEPGDSAYRGKDGPLQIEDYRTILPLTHRFVEAAQQVGFEFTKDLNSARHIGVGYSQMSRNGRFRGSTAQTFLAKARKRPNLRIVTNALATRLLFDGKRCTGVAFSQKARTKQLHAACEVIVCGGSINSPHLLQVSGIGPAEHLKSIGVNVVHNLPGVGANLSDHYAVRIAHRVKNAASVNQYARGLRLAGEVLKWLTRGDGALTFGVTTAQVFCCSREGLASPDIQLLFSPASYSAKASEIGTLEKEPGATVAANVARPESRGTIMAKSSDPKEPPAINPNYLTAKRDTEVLLAAIGHARRIFDAPALAQHIVHETAPGDALQSDQDLVSYARANGTTVHHPVGTCKMGTDPAAVVDPRLRVHGIDGLRVVDASIMPTIPSANTNAATIMIAEKGAAMIREDNGAN
jgi:choline dehydrogenase-like flavoprotein